MEGKPSSTGVLLASEGREIPDAAVEAAARRAREEGGPVFVFSIARVWGTAFGFPNPGLLPTRQEWDEQREIVDSAVKRLRKRNVDASGEVVGTRKGAKRIISAASQHGCEAIVMAADPPRSRLVSDFIWSQEPYRVRRRAHIPVELVVAAGEDR